MKLIKEAWKLVLEFRRPYIVLNSVYYGLIVVGTVFVAFSRPLQEALLKQVGEAFTKGPLAAVVGAYIGGHVWRAMILTFVVNLVGGSFASITLPSLVIPFSGLFVGGFRALIWGLLLSPSIPELRRVMVPHSLTLLLEGQAYILAMLAAYVQGRAFVWPGTVGATTHSQGYLEGVKRSGRLYLLVVIFLAVAAVYEALSVIFIIIPSAA